jgi:cysteinyl-tRNA synthetase
MSMTAWSPVGPGRTSAAWHVRKRALGTNVPVGALVDCLASVDDQEDDLMVNGRLAGISWREWSSEPTAPVSPAGSKTAARTMTAHAALGPAPTLRIAGYSVPVLGRARMYVCGITPYETTHIGHAATFVWADVAARVLGLAGAAVEVCRNVTDIDDHLLMRASREGVDWLSLASQETYRFERDMAQLRVVRPAYEPRSRDYVDEVIALAAQLLASGAAYERNGSVYFRGTDVPARAGRDRDECLELVRARGGNPDDPDKDDALDAVLWQRSVGAAPAWPSPWGPGRPGWHAECTAMSLATFGPTVDLHVGGEDLAFPHHTYESLQAEAFTGVRPFARAWMHVGSVLVEGEKMAKSAANLVYVHDVLDRFPPGALRLLILSRHWSEPWEFDEAGLEQAASELENLWRYGAESGDRDVAEHNVALALLDDLDIPRALTLAKEAGGQVLRDLIALLGLS